MSGRFTLHVDYKYSLNKFIISMGISIGMSISISIGIQIKHDTLATLI